MEGVHLFPFEYVPRDSKIIIYGAGNVGSEFIKQIMKTGWCKICFAVDQNYRKFFDFPIKVKEPYDIVTAEFDYVIIAIKNESTIKSVTNNLISMGIEQCKIVGVAGRELENFKGNIDYTETAENRKLLVAFQPTGGLGDYIISLKVYELIVSYLPNCLIDIYSRPILGKVVYGEQKNIRRIYGGELNYESFDKYDLAIEVEHVIRVRQLKYKRLANVSTEFADKILDVMNNLNEYIVDLPMQYMRDNLFIKRAVLRGINRYTALSHNGIFEIQDKHVSIVVSPKYLCEYEKLKMSKKFITFNRGADDITHDGRMQVKVWPKEYYEELLQLIHLNYPDVEIVQLGAANSEKIYNADRYCLGYDLELVKYILKGSLFHFDCEGGLVHMATQLGTKCVVVFGPTSVNYYGYKENINIVSESCKECMGVTEDWYVKCFRGLKEPECMYSITPYCVMEYIKEYIKEEAIC